MTYLSPQFGWDVFVSYAHGVPSRNGSMPLRTWSRAFIEALKNDIENLSTDLPDLKIWYDRDIDPTAKLTKELRSTVQASGILLVMISNRYLESSWCKDEREWFESQVKERIDGPSRIFVVRVQATNYGKWPQFLVDERGHPDVGFLFHPKPEREGDDVEPYGWDDLRYRPEEFRMEFARLRTALCRRLRALKNPEERKSESRAPAINERMSRLYLHGVAEDSPRRAQVESALQDRAIKVVSPPSSPPATTLVELSEQSRRHVDFAAQRCDALALIREPSNREFEYDLLDIADDQERITKVRGAPLPWAVLDAAGKPLPESVAHRGAERFDLSEADWPDRVQAWLRSIRALDWAPST